MASYLLSRGTKPFKQESTLHGLVGCLSLRALSDSISVHIEPFPRERELSE